VNPDIGTVQRYCARFYRAMLVVQSAVLLSYVVRPSVYLSVRNVDVPWAYRLDYFEGDYNNN